MSGSSIAGPLFFFSSASCRSLSSILENVRECRSRNNSESLRKTSYQVELLKNGEQVDCPVVFVSFSLRVLVTQIAATAVSVFKRWAIKMLNFFISHSDMMHVNIPKLEGWLDWEQLAWLGLTDTSKTRWSTRYILFLLFPQTLNHHTAHCGSTGVHVWDYFSARCSHSLKSLLMTSKPRNTLAPAHNPFFFLGMD